MISRSDSFLQSRYADSISINIDLIADSIRSGSFGISKNQSYFSNTSRIILLNFYDKIWMLTLIHRTMKNIEQNMIHQYIKHHKHHQIVSFILASFFDIKLFFIISSVSIDDCFHFVFVVSKTIADWLVFHIIVIISFKIFVRCSKFFCFSFFKIWVIKTIHQALTLSFDIYAFFVFCNNNSTNWVSNSNVAHHFASFSKCISISNIECFDEYQYSEYDSQSQYCSNKCFFHIFSCLWYKKSD